MLKTERPASWPYLGAGAPPLAEPVGRTLRSGVFHIGGLPAAVPPAPHEAILDSSLPVSTLVSGHSLSLSLCIHVVTVVH